MTLNTVSCSLSEKLIKLIIDGALLLSPKEVKNRLIIQENFKNLNILIAMAIKINNHF